MGKLEQVKAEIQQLDGQIEELSTEIPGLLDDIEARTRLVDERLLMRRTPVLIATRN